MTATTLPTGVRTAVADSAPSESRIDADSHFNGLYETRQNLRIEGVAEGEIQCEGHLTVAEGARVKAKVTASTMTIAGELQGEVICRGIFQIEPSGQVEATVSARRLIVQEGGLYNGEFRMIVDEAPAGSLVSEAVRRTTERSFAAASADPERSDGNTVEGEVADGTTVGDDLDEWWAKLSGRGRPEEDAGPEHDAAG